MLTSKSGRNAPRFSFKILADPLHNLSPLGTIVLKLVHTLLLDFLRHCGQSGEGLYRDPSFLPAYGPSLWVLWMGIIPNLLLHFDELLEADIAGGKLHRTTLCINDG